jgi:hypothetical protein
MSPSSQEQAARRRVVPWLLLVLPLALAAPARAEYPDWASLADAKVIEVVTRDADGDLRETKVWFVLVDDVPYLRTSRSYYSRRAHPEARPPRAANEESTRGGPETLPPRLIA